MIIKSEYKAAMATANKPKRSIAAHARVFWVLGVLGLAFLLLIFKGIYLQIKEQDFLQNQADARFLRTLKIKATRGTVADRNGAVLALSAPTQTVFATPSSMKPLSEGELKDLAHLLGMSPENVNVKLMQKTRDFVYLKRHMLPETALEIKALGIKGVGFEQESKRYYPMNEVFAHIVGFAGIDGNGQEGLELAKERVLSGEDGLRVVLRDNHGNIVDDLADVKAKRPSHGQNLVLSLDQRIQLLAYKELDQAMKINNAKAGSVVVLDAQTGEILALVNAPTYDPNKVGSSTSDSRRNRAIVDLFEPGSTMKPIPIAKAVDSGKVSPNLLMNTNPYTIGVSIVKDTHVYPSLTVAGVIQKSSNVGASKLSAMFSPEEMFTFYQNVGIGQSMHSGFPGESHGRLRSWKSWKPIEQATMSFGYGLQVNLLQLARAYSIFTTDGKLLPVSFSKQNVPPQGKQVIQPKTAEQMRLMMRAVTEVGGTARAAQVQGYDTAGKSGTARKLVNGRYQSDKHVALFVGFAPADKPRVIVAVMIDEPKGGYYGGAIAGPVFSNVVSGSLRVMGVEPDPQVMSRLLQARKNNRDKVVEDVKEET